MYVIDPDPPTNIALRQISNRRVQATWTPPGTQFSGATYHVYINTMNVNTAGTEVTGTNYTTETLNTGSTVTVRVRATTGTYLSVPALSETLTVRGNNITYLHFMCYLICIRARAKRYPIIWIFIRLVRIQTKFKSAKQQCFIARELIVLDVYNVCFLIKCCIFI